jgi:hypothetical protein
LLLSRTTCERVVRLVADDCLPSRKRACAERTSVRLEFVRSERLVEARRGCCIPWRSERVADASAFADADVPRE